MGQGMVEWRGPHALVLAWLLFWGPTAPDDSMALAKKTKKKSLAGDLGPLHHRTFKPLSGSLGPDGSVLLSSAPKKLFANGAIPTDSVALPMECNVERRDSITVESFDTEFRQRGRPLLVSAPSLADRSKAEHFSYENIKRRYGEEKVTLAFSQTPLPPPAVEQWDHFDTKNVNIIRLGLRQMGLREYMERKHSEADPLYLFSRLFWQPERATIPDFVGSRAAENTSTFIGVGRTGSGLPFHWQDDTFVEVIEGRIFWSLVSDRKSPTYNPEKTHGQWLINEKMRGADALTPSTKKGRLFCIQEAGEVMYIPAGYWQATFNLEDTVLLAHHTISENDHVHKSGADEGGNGSKRSPTRLGELLSLGADGLDKSGADEGGNGSKRSSWWSSWNTAMRLSRQGMEAKKIAEAAARAKARAKSKNESDTSDEPETPPPSTTPEVVKHLRVASQSNPGNSLLMQSLALGLLELAQEPAPADAATEGRDVWMGHLIDECAATLKKAITLNPHDLKNYYHLARMDWTKADYKAVVESLDAARALQTMDFDDDLQQFYQRAWKLMTEKQKKAHPMQYQASRIDKNGKGYPSKPVYEKGSLGADLSAALNGDEEQTELLEQLKQESARASDGQSQHGGGERTYEGEQFEMFEHLNREYASMASGIERNGGAAVEHQAPQTEPTPRKQKKSKPLGELTCEVCMRAVDNIYADIDILAKEYANQHDGAMPGPEEAEDLIQRGLENACDGVRPKKVHRACNKVLLWEITSYVEEIFKDKMGPFRTTLHDICIQRTRLCTEEEIPPAPSSDQSQGSSMPIAEQPADTDSPKDEL